MLKRILFFVLCLFGVAQLRAQRLMDFKAFDTSAYVFKLDNAQMDFVATHNGIVDTSFLFTHLHKTFSRYSNYRDSLPNGNYILAFVDQALVQYQFLNIASFEVKHRVIGNDVILFVKDKKTHANLSTAEVKINDMPVPYNEGYGGYAFDKNSVNASLLAQYKVFAKITLGKEYLVTHYMFNKFYQPRYRSRRLFKGPNSMISSGYVITDKPIYRPGDTLHLKAFLCNPVTGKPQKKHARFYITEPMQNFVFGKKLKAVTPGAFVFDWKIPDTLKIDRNFQMNFYYKKRRTTFNYSSSFYLENYELATTQFDAYVTKSEFFPNEAIRFKVEASDANGFPLQGTQVHYRLYLNSVQDFFGDTLTLSAAKRANLYEHDTIYPYENSLELRIPSSALPNMDANYGIEVTLTDASTFEQKTFNLSCSRLSKTERELLYQENDSLVVRYLYNGRDTARSYRLCTFSNGDTLSSKIITTPYRMKLSPYATQASVNDKRGQVGSINIYYNALDVSNVSGERGADSIRIRYSFPFDEAIYYRIYKKDKLVQQGKSKTLDFKIADDSKEPYSILFSSNINNALESNFYRITYVPPLHNIKLRSTLPAQAFPGQKLQVTIDALDCYDKPLKNINIAAFAVNNQFNKRFVRPVISVPEAYQDQVEVTQVPITDNITLVENNFQLQTVLNARNFSRFNLLKNEYYQLRYPKNEYSIITKKIQSPVAEFAISVTANHIAYTPKYILLDGAPVYISDLHGFPYSFQVPAGKHQISFRFADKKITLNDLTFTGNTKTWLGFNNDSIKLNSKKLIVVDSLPIAQPNDAEKNLLYGSLLLCNQFGYDSLQVLSGIETVFKSNRQAYHQPATLNIDGDYFYVFGPVTGTSSALVKLNTQEFNLKLSTDYAHYYDANKKEFTSKTRGAVKGVILGFVEEQMNDTYLASMQVYDTVKAPPTPVHLNFNADANQANRTTTEPQYTQHYNSGGPSYFSIYYKNIDTAKHVKAIWLVNKKQPEYSEFRQVDYAATLANFYKNGAEGAYDIYFLMNHRQLLVLPYHHFANGDNFYIDPARLESEELDNNKLANPLRIYTDLTKLPLLPFYFPPEESTEQVKEIKEEQRKGTYLHGYVTNESLQPVSNVLVLVEVNGKFMYGAITNNVGEYEILDMLPGTYQIKFYNASFQLKHFASRFYKAGFSYELNTALKASNLQKPVLETVQKEFRFMVFNGDVRKNILKLNVYDKDTRSALHNYTLSLREIGSETVTKTMVENQTLEVDFLPQTKVYDLEITCKGYVPVVFHNVRFCKNSFYALYLFMLNEKENQWQKKKEYDLQMQYYSATEEIGARQQGLYYAGGVNNNLSYAAGASPSVNYAPPMLESLESNSRLDEVAIVSKKFKHKLSAPTQHGVADGETVDEEQSADKATYGWSTTTHEDGGFETRSDFESYAADSMISQVLANGDLNALRKNFSDVGFWQPNLVTNKKGQVSFGIRLPDNITTWNTNILAMGPKFLHGIDTINIRAYKPLQVNALTPNFLWQGDKIWARAKFSNLTKDPKTITTKLMLDGTVLKSGTITVKNDALDSVLLEAKKLASLDFRAGLQFEEKYKDEEQRGIQVFNPAFRFFSNRSILMEKDSTYTLAFEKGSKGEIIFNNNLYEKINEEIRQLINYEYSCVEQTSSQLKALLCKEKINRALQNKENLNPAIYKLIHRLENYQNKNGTWGWWKRQPVDWRMTIYAVEALGKAKVNGYNNNSFFKGVHAIKENFASLTTSDKLYAYVVLQSFGLGDAALKKQLQGIKVENLSTNDKLHYYKAKENDGEKPSSSELYAVYLELNAGLARPYFGNFFYEPRSNLFEAYQLFAGTDSGKEFVIVFKHRLLNGQLDFNLNTYAKAALIEALTTSTEYSDNKPITAEVLVNDSLKIKNFPYRLSINRSTYKFQHRDAAVFVNTSEEQSVEHPKANDSLFKVRTKFVQNGTESKTLKAGVACKLMVDIDAYRSYDYVMVEIPIPAGMRFVNKAQQGTSSIEYFTNKVVVFYDRLPMQQHHLEFEMLPAFKGEFTWPAAKCSLMYYPYLYGNNGDGRLEVR